VWYRIVALDRAAHASGASIAAQASVPSDATSHWIRAVAIRGISPNPANPSAWIDYELPVEAVAQLDVFDSRGRRIRDLAHASTPAGSHRIHWNGLDNDGRSVASGVYWVRLTAGPHHSTAKLVILR
jgi:hypothetical protein